MKKDWPAYQYGQPQTLEAAQLRLEVTRVKLGRTLKEKEALEQALATAEDELAAAREVIAAMQTEHAAAIGELKAQLQALRGQVQYGTGREYATADKLVAAVRLRAQGVSEPEILARLDITDHVLYKLLKGNYKSRPAKSAYKTIESEGLSWVLGKASRPRKAP